MEIAERSEKKWQAWPWGPEQASSATPLILLGGFEKRTPQLKHRDVKTAKIGQSYFEISTYSTEEAFRSEETQMETKKDRT